MHIDRKDLYTDIEARIRYLHSFVDFSSSNSFPILRSVIVKAASSITNTTQGTLKPSSQAPNTSRP